MSSTSVFLWALQGHDCVWSVMWHFLSCPMRTWSDPLKCSPVMSITLKVMSTEINIIFTVYCSQQSSSSFSFFSVLDYFLILLFVGTLDHFILHVLCDTLFSLEYFYWTVSIYMAVIIKSTIISIKHWTDIVHFYELKLVK